MLKRRWAIPGLVLVGGLGLWLLIPGPRNLLGFDGGNASIALLAAVTWTPLYLLGTTQRTNIDAVVSPGEWKAWIGFAFMAVAVAVAYFVIHLQAFRTGPAADNRDAAAVVRQLVLLLIAWSVLVRVLSARWKGAVEQDERDREITRNARGLGARCADRMPADAGGHAGLFAGRPAAMGDPLHAGQPDDSGAHAGCALRVRSRRRALLARPALSAQ